MVIFFKLILELLLLFHQRWGGFVKPARCEVAKCSTKTSPVFLASASAGAHYQCPIESAPTARAQIPELSGTAS